MDLYQTFKRGVSCGYSPAREVRLISIQPLVSPLDSVRSPLRTAIGQTGKVLLP